MQQKNHKSQTNTVIKMSIQGSRLRRSGFQPVHQAKRDFVVLQRPTLSSNASRLGTERRTQGVARAEVGDFFAQLLGSATFIVVAVNFY